MKEFVHTIMSAVTTWVVKYDYNITSEAEFCALVFHQFLLHARRFKIAPKRFRHEVKFYRLNNDGQRRVASSIDFGIACSVTDLDHFVVCIEAKSWIRSRLNRGARAQDSSTSKRNQCIRDVERLQMLQKSGISKGSCLIIFEQGSSHLQRLLPSEFRKRQIAFEELWLDTKRSELGRRKEHIGIFWFHNDNNAPLATPASESQH